MGGHEELWVLSHPMCVMCVGVLVPFTGYGKAVFVLLAGFLVLYAMCINIDTDFM
jgi:hypothetical protein